EQRNEELNSAFIQDDIAFLEDRLHLIWGTKYEQNDYSNEEWQPSVRTSYSFDEALIWAAWSRAVRTPSRLEHDLALGGRPLGDRLKPEQASVYELGWRQQWHDQWHLDIAAYWAEYEDLFTSERPTFANKMQGDVKGIETSLSYQARSNWLLRLNYSHAEMDLSVSPGSRATTTPGTVEGSMPHDMLQLISLWDINPRWQLNTYLRYVDELPGQDVPSYWAGDISLLWRPAQKTRLQLVGRHLGHSERFQWGTGSSGVTAVEPDLALYLTQEF
ncbi:MAG: TonB-dependent receptor plug domain-containing protein, partial [Gammaproteobacteria bacterium]